MPIHASEGRTHRRNSARRTTRPHRLLVAPALQRTWRIRAVEARMHDAFIPKEEQMRRMLVGAVAALVVALAGSAWAQSQEPTPTTETSQTQTSDPAMADPYAESSSLPATASPMPLVAAAGMIAIAIGARMSRRRD
jgi:hypothetical protein